MMHDERYFGRHGLKYLLRYQRVLMTGKRNLDSDLIQSLSVTIATAANEIVRKWRRRVNLMVAGVVRTLIASGGDRMRQRGRDGWT